MQTKWWNPRGGGQLFLIAAALCLVAASASAQGTPAGGIAPPPRPERPYRGLFGGGVGSTAQSLTLEGNVGAGFVVNPLADQGAATKPSSPESGGGASGLGSATLSYTMDRTKFGINASNFTQVDYYSQLEAQKLVPRLIISTTVYFVPNPSTRLTVTPTFKNVPEFAFSDLFDAELAQSVPLNQDLRLSVDRYHRFGTGVELSQRLSKRSSFYADMNYGHGVIKTREWVILMGSASFTHNIGKGLAVSLGYKDGGQRDASPGAAKTSVRQPKINGGIDLNRALSFSRRTTISFTTGVAGTQDRKLNETTYHLIGSAKINREFGRTWLAGLSYNRSVRQIEQISQTALADAVTIGVQGSFTERLQFQSRAGHSTGKIGTSGTIDTQFGSVQLSFALSRQLALATDYAYYRYSAETIPEPIQVQTQKSQSIRTSLQIWVPLMKRTKRD